MPDPLLEQEALSFPNIITVARILSVPLIVWLIITGQMKLAFIAFIIAGISDGADGFIAKKFNQKTELGAYLDPIADKALLVSIYVSLGFLGDLPSWLVIMVVSRDILIIGAVLLSWMMDKPMTMSPLMVSKINTTVQIILAGLVLADLGYKLSFEVYVQLFCYVAAALTVASGVAYVIEWHRHMSNGVDDTAADSSRAD